MDASDANAESVTGPGLAEAAPPRPGPVGRARAGRHTQRGAARWKALATSNVFLGLVLAVVTWPTSTARLIVVNGVGPSWEAAVTMAAHYHLAFGSRAVFTFGPLGFLVTPQLFFVSNTVLAFIFTLAFMTAIFGGLLWTLRHSLSWPVAAVIAYFVGGMSIVSALYFDTNVAVEDVLALVLIVCVAVLSRNDNDPPPLWVWIGLGGGLGLLALVKVSLGIGIGVALVVTVVCLPSHRWRTVGRIALGAVPLFCLGWFVTGNGFGNLVAYARTSVDVIGGYGPAMAIEDPTRGYSYWLAAVAVVLIGVFAVAYTRGMARRAQIGIGLITLSTLWFLFKEGFVRHDEHDLVFFVAAPIVLAAFAPRWRSRAWLVTGMLGLTIVTASVAGTVPGIITQPVQSARHFFGEAATLASAHKRSVIVTQSRQLLHQQFALPATMVNAIRGKTLDVSPWQQTVTWAHPSFRFDPLPVLQDYSAFTPSLDQLDTTFLRSAGAPRYILRTPVAIDGRNPAFEPPATQLAIECRYRQVSTDPVWQLVERQPDRCGHARPLGTVTTGLGHWVSVPTPRAGDAIVASFQLPTDLWSKLQSLVYKPPNVFLAANNGLETWRFVEATGPELHVLHAASTLGYSPAFVPVSVRDLRFSTNGGARSTSGITISFYEVPMAPPRAGVAAR